MVVEITNAVSTLCVVAVVALIGLYGVRVTRLMRQRRGRDAKDTKSRTRSRGVRKCLESRESRMTEEALVDADVEGAEKPEGPPSATAPRRTGKAPGRKAKGGEGGGLLEVEMAEDART
jgi:hypothetical protein